MKTIKRPKNWVKADAVRVRRVNGKTVVEIRRKKKRNAGKYSYRKTKKALKRAGFSGSDAVPTPRRKKRLNPVNKRVSKRKATRQRKTKKKGRR